MSTVAACRHSSYGCQSQLVVSRYNRFVRDSPGAIYNSQNRSILTTNCGTSNSVNSTNSFGKLLLSSVTQFRFSFHKLHRTITDRTAMTIQNCRVVFDIWRLTVDEKKHRKRPANVANQSQQWLLNQRFFSVLVNLNIPLRWVLCDIIISSSISSRNNITTDGGGSDDSTFRRQSADVTPQHFSTHRDLDWPWPAIQTPLQPTAYPRSRDCPVHSGLVQIIVKQCIYMST